ncbi:MAG: 16S rRNA (cytosine(1402)-N(4))-methyltransferase RsmH [Syntrophales bacterium]
MEAKDKGVFHRPVMIAEVLAALQCRSGGVYLDGTAGGGGHAFEILKGSAPDGLLVALDVDGEAIEETKKKLIAFGSRAVLVNSNFSAMRAVLAGMGISKVDGILLDLGVSSHQLDSAVRGFSFTLDAPLDMRMDKNRGPSAYDLVNSLSREELEKIIREYGEERMARRIATAVTKRRAISAIRTTTELAGIVAGACPKMRGAARIHPATRTFQAIRIAVNNELRNIEQAIEDGAELLRSGGRFCVISFHSLEDRIVKNSFSAREKGCICPPDFPVCACGRKPTLKIVTKKPIIPSESEISENPRSRSAKLRAAEKI